jgi:magnesium-transporting ATPase (P-type)
VFLASALATSITGFGFPLTPFLPSHVIGIISLVVLAVAAIALYVFHLAGAWRWLYVLSVVTLLYFNVFILVVQLFRKVPTLHALAPTESEPPLLIAQAVVLAVFVALAIAGTIKFHSRPRLAA